jgi:hypothetical protein
MTDYGSLLARAVSALRPNTGEGRRVIYDRARQALRKQLKDVQPPLDEDIITRERLALEGSIRQVETTACSTSSNQVRFRSRSRAPDLSQSSQETKGRFSPRGEDPLAELARLIGQDDPFAEFSVRWPSTPHLPVPTQLTVSKNETSKELKAAETTSVRKSLEIQTKVFESTFLRKARHLLAKSLRTAKPYIMLRPNIMGIGIDFGKIIDDFSNEKVTDSSSKN